MAENITILPTYHSITKSKHMKTTLIKIQTLFPHSEKLLLHLPIGAVVAALTLLYSSDTYEIMRNVNYVASMKEFWDIGRTKKVNMENFMDLLATEMGGVIVVLVVNC